MDDVPYFSTWFEVAPADPSGYWLIPQKSSDPKEWAAMELPNPVDEIDTLRARLDLQPLPPPLDGLHGGPLVNVVARYEDGSEASLNDGWRWVGFANPQIKTDRRGWWFRRDAIDDAEEE